MVMKMMVFVIHPSNWWNKILIAVSISKTFEFVWISANFISGVRESDKVRWSSSFPNPDKRPLLRHFILNKFHFFIQRNGTLTEVSTINTGHKGMDKFGYLDRLNGLDHLPFWDNEPCTNITASEGSFFPPREFTNNDRRYVYDKDLCRIIPLDYTGSVYKDGKFKIYSFAIYRLRISKLMDQQCPKI